MAAWLWAASRRIPYPFELEWLEGVSIDHLERVVKGLPLYVAPGVDWVPFSYPPLAYLAAWPFASVMGVGFAPMRLMSALATVGTMGLFAWLVHRETGSRAAAVATAGLYAATFRISGAWFDVARVDPLFVFLFVAALALVRGGRALPSALAAGIAIALAGLTKQTALGLAPALFVAALVQPWRALAMAGAGALTLGSAVWQLHDGSDGWFSYYAFLLPRKHYDFGCAPTFWQDDVLRPLPVAVGLSIALLIGLAVARRFGTLVAYGVTGAAAMGATWVSRIHCGGYDNVLMPGYAMLVLLAGLAAGFAARVGWPVALAVWLALAGQLALLRYDLPAQVPTAQDLAAGKQLEERLRAIPGSVWVFQHSRFGPDAGKPGFAQWMAICDVLRDPDPGVREKLGQEILAAVQWKRCAAIVTDDAYFPAPLATYYQKVGPAVDSPDALWTVTGMRARPGWIWRARGEPVTP